MALCFYQCYQIMLIICDVFIKISCLFTVYIFLAFGFVQSDTQAKIRRHF